MHYQNFGHQILAAMSSELREDIVVAAARFLVHPQARRAPVRSRIDYLTRERGLSRAEVAEAVRRAVAEDVGAFAEAGPGDGGGSASLAAGDARWGGDASGGGGGGGEGAGAWARLALPVAAALCAGAAVSYLAHVPPHPPPPPPPPLLMQQPPPPMGQPMLPYGVPPLGGDGGYPPLAGYGGAPDAVAAAAGSSGSGGSAEPGEGTVDAGVRESLAALRAEVKQLWTVVKAQGASLQAAVDAMRLAAGGAGTPAAATAAAIADIRGMIAAQSGGGGVAELRGELASLRAAVAAGGGDEASPGGGGGVGGVRRSLSESVGSAGAGRPPPPAFMKALSLDVGGGGADPLALGRSGAARGGAADALGLPAPEATDAEGERGRGGDGAAAGSAGTKGERVRGEGACRALPSYAHPTRACVCPVRVQIRAVREAVAALSSRAAPGGVADACQFIAMLARNLLASPSVPRYRRVATSNASYRACVADVPGAADALAAIGFRLGAGGAYHEWTWDHEDVAANAPALEAAIATLDAAAVVAKAGSKAAAGEGGGAAALLSPTRGGLAQPPSGSGGGEAATAAGAVAGGAPPPGTPVAPARDALGVGGATAALAAPPLPPPEPPTPAAVAGPAPPYPPSFSEVMQLVQTGVDPPGIAAVEARLSSSAPTPAAAPPLPKPYAVGGADGGAPPLLLLGGGIATPPGAAVGAAAPLSGALRASFADVLRGGAGRAGGGAVGTPDAAASAR